jgi:hypothetical protein
MKTLIIQTSPYHTASTFLVNAIYGLIPELVNTKIIGIWDEDIESYFDNIIVLKCHDTNIDGLIKKYDKFYNLLFICSERQEKNYMIDDKYKKYNNVIVFDFNELNELNDNTLPKIVDNIYCKFDNMLCNLNITNIDLNKENCIERLTQMNRRYEEIKHKPFTYVDDFFEIHGSHRDRKNMC